MAKKFKNPWAKGGEQWNPNVLFSKAIDDSSLFNKEPEGDNFQNVETEFPTPGTRPSWEILLGNYPGPEVPTLELYQNIGGYLAQFKTQTELDASQYVNSCAFRMSYGLNYAGMPLPRRKTARDLVLKGDDGKYYWGRVPELYDIMRNDLFGKPDLEFSLPKAGIGEPKQGPTTDQWSQLRSKRGIVTFHVSGWSDAFGHFTLWDGEHLVYPGNPNHDDPSSNKYYFHMKYDVPIDNDKTIVVQTDKISLWEFE